jgi:hypothetical protein
MPKYRSHILELAKRGAEHRYAELKAEIELLLRHFPHIRGVSHGVLPSLVEAVNHPIRRRRRMSAAARKAVGVRMKKYWAARRKAAAKWTGHLGLAHARRRV